MEYARIVVNSNYEKRGDLVLRSYIRAIKKIKANLLLSLDLLSNNEKAYIYGIIKEDNKFHELLTDKVIDYDDYEIVSGEEIHALKFLPISLLHSIKKVIERVIFNMNVDLGFEISNIEELAEDRVVEFEAYNKFLSGISPYQRLNEKNQDNNAYNNFLYKIEMIKKLKENNQEVVDYDEYDINNYQEFRNIEKEGLVLKKIKK